MSGPSDDPHVTDGAGGNDTVTGGQGNDHIDPVTIRQDVGRGT